MGRGLEWVLAGPGAVGGRGRGGRAEAVSGDRRDDIKCRVVFRGAVRRATVHLTGVPNGS